jgi:hypothetical protein
VLVVGSELDAVKMRLLEVVAEDLVQLDEIVAVRLQPLGKPLVQVRARRLGQRVVGSVSDQMCRNRKASSPANCGLSGRTSSFRISDESRSIIAASSGESA